MLPSANNNKAHMHFVMGGRKPIKNVIHSVHNTIAQMRIGFIDGCHQF